MKERTLYGEGKSKCTKTIDEDPLEIRKTQEE
jgi:hypothetical protein